MIRDAAKIKDAPSPTDGCPLCGGKVLYRGFIYVACAGAARPAVPAKGGYMGGPKPTPAIPAKPACPNFRPGSVPSGHSLSWAREQHTAGRAVGYIWQGTEGDPIYSNPTSSSWDAWGDCADWYLI